MRRPPAELAPRRTLLRACTARLCLYTARAQRVHCTCTARGPRRAGLDYWPLVDCVHHTTWEDYLAAAARHGQACVFLTAAAAELDAWGSKRPRGAGDPSDSCAELGWLWARTAALEPLRGAYQRCRARGPTAF